MELGFIFSALKRRWWIVVITTIAFGFLSSLVFESGDTEFKSEAVLLVVPNSRGGQLQSFGDANRYVQGQISAMESTTFENAVAERLGGSVTGDFIGRSVELDNEANTDVVTVSVFTDSPTLSEDIATAFSRQYLFQLQNQRDDDQGDFQETLTERRDDLALQIQEVNQEIARTVQPFLDRLLTNGTGTIDASLIDPVNTTERDVLLSELDKTLEQLTALESGDEVKVNSAILQTASAPEEPTVESNSLQIAAGAIGGLGLGCLIALLLNRFSTKVSDEAMVSEILGLPIAGTVPASRAIARRPVTALLDPPETIRTDMGRVAVSAEALGPVDRPTRIVVVGAQRGAGTTTLAMLIAHEFGTLDADVALIDADPRGRQLHAIGGTARTTFGHLTTNSLDHYTSGVVIVGPSIGEARLRRADVRSFMELVGSSSRLVVIDAGSVLSSAATVELCEAADAVVLAVPTNRQNIATLQAVARTIQRDDAIVVTTSPKRFGHTPEPVPSRTRDETDPLGLPAERETASSSAG